MYTRQNRLSGGRWLDVRLAQLCRRRCRIQRAARLELQVRPIRRLQLLSSKHQYLRLQFFRASGAGLRRSNGQLAGPSTPVLTEDETWQSLRVGVSAVATIWDRFGMSGDVAYLPYAQYSGLDSHLFRVPTTFFPAKRHRTRRANGTHPDLSCDRESQARHRRTLLGDVDQSGARPKAAMATGGGSSSSPPLPYTANAERFGTFVQMSYRFAPHP